jgi:hypothetical protein
MNRDHHLKITLPSWATLPVNEIVIVEWGTNTLSSYIKDIRTRINIPIIHVRVVDQSKWILSQAFNIAARFASFTQLLKVDADVSLLPSFTGAHSLKEGIFFTGDWRAAQTINERHLNGLIYMNTSDFFKVKGYSEYITTYGWDDSCLYERLEKIGLRRKVIHNGHARHLPHEAIERYQHQIINDQRRLDVQIECNRLLSQRVPWKGPMREYSLLGHDHETDFVIRMADDGMMIDDKVYQECLLQASKKPIPSSIFVPAARNKRLYIECKNGLGNRLRALASAYCIARATKRDLFIIWQADMHCDALLHELFDVEDMVRKAKEQGLTVVMESSTEIRNNIICEVLEVHEHLNIESFDSEIAWFLPQGRIDGRFYDYMNVLYKNIPINTDVEKDIYVAAASVLKHPSSSWREENNFLKSLEPVKEIQEVLDNWYKHNPTHKRRVGVHIRMGQNVENAPYEDFTNWATESQTSLLKWRNGSHWKIFESKMREILANDPSTEFFLCADNEFIYEEIKNSFGQAVSFQPRSTYDRSKEQIRSAVIDVYLLAATKSLLGSNWSTFTEIAQRMGGQKVSLASVDF